MSEPGATSGSVGASSPARSVRARFSAAASVYGDRAHIQREIAKRLVLLLPPRLLASRILEVGCGTGILTQMLSVRFPYARIEAIDLSRDMVAKAERAIPLPRIRWIVGDAAHFRGRRRYPLIISSSSLQWMIPFREAIQNLASLLCGDGLLAFSMMMDGSLSELRNARLEVAPDKPPLGRLPTEDEIGQALGASRLWVSSWHTRTVRAQYPSVEEFLSSIRQLGVTGGDVSKAERPLNRSEIGQLIECYRSQNAVPGGGVYASYKVCFVQARPRGALRREGIQPLFTPQH